MTITTETTGVTPAPRGYRGAVQTLFAREGVHVIGRWLLVAGLVVAFRLVLDTPFYPIEMTNLVQVVTIVFALFALVNTIALFIPPMAPLFTFASLVDIVLLLVLMLASSTLVPLFFPLLLLPLMALAAHFGPVASLGLGALAALLYAGGTIITGGFPDGAQGWATLVVQVIGLAAVAGVASTLLTRNEAGGAASSALVGDSSKGAASTDKQQNAFVAVGEVLATNLQSDRVLTALLEEGPRVVPYDAGFVLLPKGPPGELHIPDGYNLNLTDRGGTVLVAASSKLVPLFSPDAVPQPVSDFSTYPELAALSTVQDHKHGCLVPLRANMQVYGLLVVLRKGGKVMTSEQCQALATLATFGTVALLNSDLTAETRKERVDLMHAEERARHWLAREIHDGLAQKLAAMTMNTEIIRKQMDSQPDEARKELERLHDLYKRANHDVRTLLGELKPTTLDTKGLPAALQEYVDRLRTSHQHMTFHFEARGTAGMTLSPDARSALWMIAQESLNNALKYAKASVINVQIVRDKDRLTMTIQDDGKGFDVEQSRDKARDRGSYGLSNLTDRARAVGGVTDVQSSPGNGTTVTVYVPLETTAAA